MKKAVDSSVPLLNPTFAAIFESSKDLAPAVDPASSDSMPVMQSCSAEAPPLFDLSGASRNEPLHVPVSNKKLEEMNLQIQKQGLSDAVVDQLVD